MAPRFPNNAQRVAIVGKTGTGKTVFSVHVLSKMDYDTQPWIIVDYKYDILLNSIKGVQELSLKSRLPTKPGLYIVHPMVGDDEAIEKWLWGVWEHERIGLYFDEGMLIPSNRSYSFRGAYQAIQMQGRSKRIPTITVSQRPSGVSQAMFSEADFIASLYLNVAPDIAKMNSMTPVGFMSGLKQDFSCRWYDVGRNEISVFSPAPDPATIRARIEERLRQRRKRI